MAREKICGIYKITNNVNGKVYVGQSVGIKERWNDHKKKLRRNKHHCKHLQNAWNKYGENNFTFEIIETCEQDKEILKEREQYWMDFTRCADEEYGYNTCKSAESTLGFKHNSETIQKISDSKKGKKTWMFGKHHTPESKQKLSDSKKGEKNVWFGKKHTPEELQKMSESQKGQKGHWFGKKASPETRKKLSEMRSGEKHHNAILTQEIVDEIRYNIENGMFTRKEMRIKYGVSAGCIQGVVTYKTWNKKQSSQIFQDDQFVNEYNVDIDFPNDNNANNGDTCNNSNNANNDNNLPNFDKFTDYQNYPDFSIITYSDTDPPLFI